MFFQNFQVEHLNVYAELFAWGLTGFWHTPTTALLIFSSQSLIVWPADTDEDSGLMAMALGFTCNMASMHVGRRKSACKPTCKNNQAIYVIATSNGSRASPHRGWRIRCGEGSVCVSCSRQRCGVFYCFAKY